MNENINNTSNAPEEVVEVGVEVAKNEVATGAKEHPKTEPQAGKRRKKGSLRGWICLPRWVCLCCRVWWVAWWLW